MKDRLSPYKTECSNGVQKPAVSGILQLQDQNFTNTNSLQMVPDLTYKCVSAHSHV